MAWLPVNIEQILNNRIPDVRQNIPAYVPQVVPNVSAVVPNVPVVLPNVVTNVPNTRATNTNTNTNKQSRLTGMLSPASSLDNIPANVNTIIDDTSGYYDGPNNDYWTDLLGNVNKFPAIWDYLNIGYTSKEFFPEGKPDWEALGRLLGQGSLSGTPKWIEEIMTQEGGREWFEKTVLPNILNQIKSQYPDFADKIDEFQDFINAGGNVEDWDSGGGDDDDDDEDTVAKQEAADFGQQILDATSVDELADLLSNNPDMKNNPHLTSWIEATGQFPITDDVGIWADLDQIFAECVQGRPCDIESVLDNLGIMFPSIIDLPEWAKILGVGIFKLPSIWEMMQKVGGIFDTISGKIECTRVDDDGEGGYVERDCTATERISNSLCVLQPNADCCISDTCSPGDLIGGAIGSVVGIGTDVLGQVIGKIETLEDKITGAGKYGDILTGNCKKPDGTPKECTWADLPSEVLDDLIDIFGSDSSKWPPWVWAIIGSSVLGGIVTKTNLITAEEECAERGGTWNGTSCELPDTPTENYCSDTYGKGARENDSSPSGCEKPCNGGWIDADLVCEQSLGCPEGGCPDVDGVPYKCDPVLDKCVPDVEGTSCAEQNRQDNPADPTTCGGCLGNFVDIDGVCVEKQTCSDPNSQVNADGSCGECNSGYNRNETDLCVPDTDTPVQDCSNPEYAAANPEECKNTDPDCAAQNRVTVSTGDRGIGAGETSCGKCINGYTEDGEGNCIPFKYTCSDPNATVLEDGRCGPCKEGYVYGTDSCIPKGSGPGTPSDDDNDDLDLSGGGGGGGGQTNFTPFTGGPQWNPAKIGLAALPMSMMSSEGFLQGLLGGSTEEQPQQTAFNQFQKQQNGLLDAQNKFANAYNQYAVAPASFFNFLNQGRG